MDYDTSDVISDALVSLANKDDQSYVSHSSINVRDTQPLVSYTLDASSIQPSSSYVESGNPDLSTLHDSTPIDSQATLDAPVPTVMKELQPPSLHVLASIVVEDLQMSTSHHSSPPLAYPLDSRESRATIEHPSTSHGNETKQTHVEYVCDNKLVLPLMEIFPDACPQYLRQLCHQKVYSPQLMDELTTLMLNGE